MQRLESRLMSSRLHAVPLSRRDCLALSLAPVIAAAAEPIPLRYARFSAGEDPRVQFPLALLDLALARAGLVLQAQPSETVMERTRAIEEVDQGRVDIVWTSLGREVEQRLRPIRIPIYRGLIGQRIFLIHRERERDFERVRKVEDLAPFTAGQGTGWVDTQILQAAGLKVVTNTYDSLFRMLSRGQIDYFPRGASEAWGEVKARAAEFPELRVESHLLLAYRSDNVFFVGRHNEALAQKIETGLAAAHADGAYQRLFDHHPYVQKVLTEARLNRRLRLEIPNPMLSDEDRAIPERYWM